MALLGMLVRIAIPTVLTVLAYGINCAFQHRRKINELRKQGVVSAH